MPDQVIDIPGVGGVAFPESMSPEDVNKAAAKLYAQANPKDAPAGYKRSWVDSAVDWLPTAGGMAGAMVGTVGGTVAGMGVGGVPGAIGGAALGGAAGEAAKQLLNRARGAEAPATPEDAASSIAGQGMAQGIGAAVGEGLGAVARPVLQAAGRFGGAVAKRVGDATGIVDADLLSIASPRAGAVLKKAQQVQDILAKRSGTASAEVPKPMGAPVETTAPVASVPSPVSSANSVPRGTSLSPQRIRNELGLAARRNGVTLTPETEAAAAEAMRGGVTAEQAVSALKGEDAATAAQKAFAEKFHLPDSDYIRQRVQRRNQSGRWD